MNPNDIANILFVPGNTSQNQDVLGLIDLVSPYVQEAVDKNRDVTEGNGPKKRDPSNGSGPKKQHPSNGSGPKRPDPSNESGPNGAKKRIPVIEENMRKIVKLYTEEIDARFEFLESFPGFDGKRTKTVNSLERLGRNMSEAQEFCNTGRVISRATSLLGALGVIASVCFPPAAPILIPGAVAGMCGNAAAFAFSEGHRESLKKNTKEVRLLVAADMERFEALSDWLMHSKGLLASFASLLGIDACTKIYRCAKQYSRDVLDNSSLRETFVGALKKMLKTLGPSIKERLKELGACGAAWGAAAFNPVVASVVFLLVAVILQMRSIYLFDAFCVVSGALAMWAYTTDMGVSLGRGVAALVIEGGELAAAQLSPKVARGFFAGAFAAINVVLDGVDLIVTAKKINEGCEKGKEVLACAEGLREEQKVLQKVYEELRKL